MGPDDGLDTCDESASANLSACHSASALLDVMRLAAPTANVSDDQSATGFASREVLLRIISTLQSEKATMDAQLRALTSECASLRAANLEKDQQLAQLLATRQEPLPPHSLRLAAIPSEDSDATQK